MRRLIEFYKNVTIISLTVAVAEAAIGWKLHGWSGMLVSLFFVGLALGAFIVSVHIKDMDDKIRQGFLDHLNVLEPRLQQMQDEGLLREAQDLRATILSGGLLVQISHRFGALNSKMIDRGLLAGTPVVASAHI